MQSYCSSFWTFLITILMIISIQAYQDPAVKGYLIVDLTASPLHSFDIQASYWQASGLVSSNVKYKYCGPFLYLGGMNILNNGGYFERIYTGLPAHDIVYFTLKLAIIDRWNPTDSFSVHFDGRPVITNLNPGQDEPNFHRNICEAGYNDALFEFIGKTFHTGTSLTVRITVNLANSPLVGGIGGRAFNFILRQKQPGEIESVCANAEALETTLSAPYLCQCKIGTFVDSGGSCTSCNVGCRNCYGPSLDVCYSYNSGYSFDGTHGVTCFTGCNWCFGPNSNQCTTCSTIINWDNTCVTSCLPPYFTESVPQTRCRTPCQAQDTFMYWDNSCSPVCEAPLTQRLYTYAKFCDYTCTSASEFLRWDRVCVTSCETPAIQATILGKTICQHPCEITSYYFYPDEKNSCKPTCNYPFKVVTKSDIQYCVLDIAEDNAQQAQQIAKISTISADATNVGGILIAMLTYNNPGLLLMSSMTEMLQYIQYLGIDYPPKLYLMLQEQDVNAGGINIITEIPKEVEEAIPNHPLPIEFEKNDTHSSFVANSWEFLMSLNIILIFICLIWGLRKWTRNYRRVQASLDMVLRSLRWNLLLGVFCSSYGFTAIFTALEFRTVNMSSILSIISFIISLIVNVVGFFVLFLIVQLSVSFQTIKRAKTSSKDQAEQIEEVEKKWKNYEVLFGDYKNDHLSQKIYLFIFMIRTYLHYSVLGYLNKETLLQTILFTIMSLFMISYMILRRPIKSILNFIQQLLCELAILIVNTCVVIFASMEKWEIGTNETKEKVGDVVVATNLGLSIISSLFLGIELFLKIKEAWIYARNWYKTLKHSKNYNFPNIPGKNPLKVRNPRINPRTQSKEDDLQISELEISHDVSKDPLAEKSLQF